MKDIKILNDDTKKFCSKLRNKLVRGIVYADENYIEYGFFPKTNLIVLAKRYEDDWSIVYAKSEEAIAKRFIYSNYIGYYIDKNSSDGLNIKFHTHIKGNGNFPYTFDRKYEAVESFNIFNNSQQILEDIKYPISDVFDYTFGLEFETTQGYIPQHICFRDGLIPLRDGSISGLEYSTVVLQGNEGINLLHQQLNTLKKYTYFDKECALHIHFGNYPVTTKHIYALYQVWRRLEYTLSVSTTTLPRYTFETHKYKKNAKDYCKKLPPAYSFNDIYGMMVGRSYLGDLTQPHPKDINRRAKWNIPTRYYALNLINMLCYSNPKTVEFRFLRPTYNFNKIILWLYLLNAVLKYSEKLGNCNLSNDDIINITSNLNFTTIIKDIYNAPLAEKILNGLEMLRIVTINQTNNNDLCGSNLIIEEDIFNDSQGILW